MPSRLQILFEKYLNKQCNPKEIEELVTLLQQADAEHQLTTPMQGLWDSLRNRRANYDVDWETMYSSIIKSEEHAENAISRSTSKRSHFYWAAAAILFVCLGTAMGWMLFTSPSRQAPKNKDIVITPKKKIENMRQTIHLPDGSTVVLNIGSTLKYPSAFKAGRRDVYLSGEGYFDIKHTPSQPFYVHTGKLLVKVLGTVFNIKSYPEQSNIEVTVTRGKVQVMKENKTLGVLTSSQQISYANSSENVVLRRVDTSKVIAWKPAELHFDDIKMEEAAKRIEQRFNLIIEFANPAIKECRVTATFSEDDMAEEVLAVICAVSKAEYSFNHNKIIIDGKGCN